MKKKLSLYFFLSSLNVLLCQKVEYGLGVGVGGYFFNHTDKKRFENDVLQPASAISGGVLGYVGFRSDYKFQIRSNVYLTYKPIIFSSTFQDAGGTRLTNAMTFNFFSADFSLLGLYKIELKKSNILPFAGLYYSFNEFIDVSFSQRKSSFGTGNTTTVTAGGQAFATDFVPTNVSKSNNFGINTGLFWHPHLLRKCDFFIIAYLSATNFFDGNFEYKSLNQKRYLQGQYNYFILGANYRLSKNKSSAE